VVRNLEGDYVEEMGEAEKAEAENQAAYEIIEQEKTRIRDASKEEFDNKHTAILEAERKRTKAQEILDKATQDMEVAKKFKQDNMRVCEQAAMTYDDAQKKRDKTIQGIEKAEGILNAGEAGRAANHFSDATEAAAGALIQMSVKLTVSEPQQEAGSYLRSQAEALDSKVLLQVAQLATDSPFGKIKGIIRTLIEKLKKEVQEESSKQAECAIEIQENDRETKEQREMQQRSAVNRDLLTDNVAETKENLGNLQDEMAAQQQELAEGQKIRADDSTTNTQIITETKAGIEAVGRAIEVLKSIESGESEALIQKSLLQEKQVPVFGGETPASPNAPGSSTGLANVISAIETILAKMEQTLVATENAEREAVAEWTNETKANLEQDITMKQYDESKMKAELAKYESALIGAKDDLKLATEKVESLVKTRNEYIDPKCVQTAVSFEERDKKRKAEIQSLNEALEILQSPDA